MLTFLYNINANYDKSVEKRNDFVFIIHQVNKHRVSGVKHFKSGALRTITKRTRSMVNWKKEFLHRCVSKMLFIDIEQLIYLQVSLKNFIDRFGTIYLKSRFIWRYFSKILLIDFRIATNLKTGSSKKYSQKTFFVGSKTSTTKIIHLKVH